MDNVSPSAGIRLNNVDLEFHPHPQWNGSRDQRAMEVHYDRLTVVDKRVGDALSLDHHFQLNASASSGFTRAVNYRNTWFWIDDPDLRSKLVFLQLMNLFTMADTAPRENQNSGHDSGALN
jgi:hypothetical protein